MELSLQEVCWGELLRFTPVGEGKERKQDWQTEKLDCHATTVDSANPTMSTGSSEAQTGLGVW